MPDGHADVGTQAELEHDSWGEPRARGDGRVADMRLRPPVFDRAPLAAHPSEPQFPVSHGMMIAAASRRRGRARSRAQPWGARCSLSGPLAVGQDVGSARPRSATLLALAKPQCPRLDVGEGDSVSFRDVRSSRDVGQTRHMARGGAWGQVPGAAPPCPPSLGARLCSPHLCAPPPSLPPPHLLWEALGSAPCLVCGGGTRSLPFVGVDEHGALGVSPGRT